MKSIKLKIVLVAGVCLLMTAAILIGYGVYSTSKTKDSVSSYVKGILEKNAEDYLESLAGNCAATVEKTLQDNIDTARTTSKVFETLRKTISKDIVRETFVKILRANLENNPGYLGSYTAWEANALDGRDADFANTEAHDATGRFITYWNKDGSGKINRQALVEYESDAKHQNGVPKSAWYLTPRSTGKENVLDPIPYVIQGKTEWIATISIPILENGKFLGISGTDLRLETIQKMASDVDSQLYDGKGAVIILSHAGIVVANSAVPETIGKDFSAVFTNRQLLNDVQAGKQYVHSSEDGKEYLAIAPIKLGRSGKFWSVIVRIPKTVVLAEAIALEATLEKRASNDAYSQVLTGLGVSLVALLILWVFASSLTKPLIKSTAFASNVAKGNFDHQLDVVQSDEIGVLADSLRIMVNNLRDKIAQAQVKGEEAQKAMEEAQLAMREAQEAKELAEHAKADGMLQAAQQIEGVVDIVTSASTELSAQIDQSSHGAEEQSNRVREIATAADEMNATVIEVAKNAQHAAEASAQTKQKAIDGENVVKQVVAGIESVCVQSEGIKTDMDVLGKQAENIGSVLNVISDIADQTNLLALNAAIEAARAGEAGRGFAVVADEVRKLAEKTMSATLEVDQAIRAIQSGTRKNIEGVERSVDAIREATGLASRSGQSLREIVTLIEMVNDQVHAIATASEQQSATSEEITRSMEQVASISEGTVNAMSQAAHAMTELAQQSQVLNNLISEMKSEG